MKAVALLAVLAACTQRYAVTDLDHGARIDVRTTDGSIRRAYVVVGNGGEIQFFDPNNQRIPDAYIDEVSDSNHVRGVIVGAGAGAAGGFAMGALFGLAVTASVDPDCDDSKGGPSCDPDRGDAMLGFGLVVALLGLPIGALIGGVIGTKVVYESRVVPTGPPGSTVGLTVRF